MGAGEDITVKLPFGATDLEISSGLLAKQASGSVTVRWGETVVLVTAQVNRRPKEGADFFPLTVDFEERFYASGKISGSRFIKREGRPSDEAILKARIVDRSIRPMFPKTYRNEIQVIITALSYDENHDMSAMAVVGASCALLASGAPFDGPIGAVKVGLVDGQFVLNPTEAELSQSPLDLLVSGNREKVNMIEARASEVGEEQVLQAIEFARQAIVQLLEGQKLFTGEKNYQDEELLEPEIFQQTLELIGERFEQAATERDPLKREEILSGFENELLEKAGDQVSESVVKEAVKNGFLKSIHKMILQKKQRPDGRQIDEVRPLSVMVGLLPRVHGSALFNRGETQALTIATLGGPGQEQWIDTMEDFVKKRFIHHYNFPPYSTGEIRPMRGQGRREVGHGALAEKALEGMIPPKEEFPYTIRLVSEILASNGSTSMAATCASSLALMDAGVPIKKAVAGIAMGLVSENEENFLVLTDLQGLEDFAGEMDFKIAGTQDGITAIQLDVKNKGLTAKMIEQTLLQARKGRIEILGAMNKVIDKPRRELSALAPRIYVTKIDPLKIGELIGPGGKTINKIIDDEGGREEVNIDIEDDGTVMITSNDAQKAARVRALVESIGMPITAGQEFEGEVTSIVKDRNSGKEIGAIVQLTPNADGMIHISSLGNGTFVKNIGDVVKIGDKIRVRVKEVDLERGRISLTKIS